MFALDPRQLLLLAAIRATLALWPIAASIAHAALVATAVSQVRRRALLMSFVMVRSCYIVMMMLLYCGLA